MYVLRHPIAERGAGAGYDWGVEGREGTGEDGGQ